MMDELEKRTVDSPIRTIFILMAIFSNGMRALHRDHQLHLFDALMKSSDQILDLPSCGLSTHDQSLVKTLLARLEDPRPSPPELSVVPTE